MSTSIAWIDGHWGTAATLSLPLDDRGVLLADGLFETVLIRNEQPQLLHEHLQRWTNSAALLGMDPPPQPAWARRVSPSRRTERIRMLLSKVPSQSIRRIEPQ